MATIFSSPTLELRPKRIRMERALMDGNILVFKGDYAGAIDVYSRFLDEKCHPAAYLNRSLCYIATNQPHLAVNDALRAYVMAQAVLDVIRKDANVNDHIRRIDNYIVTYTDDCKDALSRKENWCKAPSTMFRPEHQKFRLTKMTLVEESTGPEEAKQKRPVAETLKFKALFRLIDALSRCGNGPARAALHILDDEFTVNASMPPEEAMPFVSLKQLKALAQSIQDELLEKVINNIKPSPNDLSLTESGYCLLKHEDYGYVKSPISYPVLNNCILSVDENSIARYEYKFGIPTSLVASQDVFQGMVLFTECLPFAVSTANTSDMSTMSMTCDTCQADLQVPPPFILRVLIEELKQAEAEATTKREARASKRAAKEARSKPSPGHRRTAAVDLSPIKSNPSDRGGSKKHEDDEPSPDSEDEDEAGKPGSDSDDDDWGTESSSEATDTFSEHSFPDTPLRGKQSHKPGIFETSDIQVCRSGNEKLRENFSFCSVECYDLAKSTYHDSVCGSHLEDYLRKTIIRIDHPDLPSVTAQKLTLLLLARILGWAFATSTDPLDLPVVKLLMGSPRHRALHEGSDPVAWSYHNNVMRPFQILQAMDGRGDAPKSVSNPDYSDGRVINTIIGLVQRHLVMTDKFSWTKTYDEEGYHEQTFPHKAKKEDEKMTLGRLHPLCDLVPIAANPEDANVELVDLGDGRTICLPVFDAGLESDDTKACIKRGTRLLLHNPVPRLATAAERTAYGKKDDYGEGGTMMDAEHEEAVFYEEENGDVEDEEEEMEEFSGYVDEKSYGARDDYTDDFEVDDEDDDMMDF